MARVRSPNGLTPAQAEKVRQVEAARVAFLSLSRMHRTEFSSPVPGVASVVKLPKFHKLLVTAEKTALRGVRVHDRSGRRAARGVARQQAEAWATDLWTMAGADVAARQQAIDTHWQALRANEPHVVSRTLADEFARQGRSIRVTRVQDGEAGLLTTIPTSDVIPAAKPGVTSSGAPTLHKVNKSESAEWYARVVASHILLAAKEAFALAPGLTAARVVAVDVAGTPVVAAHIARDRLARVDWNADAWAILFWLDAHLRFDARGRTRDLRTIDLRADEAFGPILR